MRPHLGHHLARDHLSARIGGAGSEREPPVPLRGADRRRLVQMARAVSAVHALGARRARADGRRDVRPELRLRLSRGAACRLRTGGDRLFGEPAALHARHAALFQAAGYGPHGARFPVRHRGYHARVLARVRPPGAEPQRGARGGIHSACGADLHRGRPARAAQPPAQTSWLADHGLEHGLRRPGFAHRGAGARPASSSAGSAWRALPTSASWRRWLRSWCPRCSRALSGIRSPQLASRFRSWATCWCWAGETASAGKRN